MKKQSESKIAYSSLPLLAAIPVAAVGVAKIKISEKAIIFTLVVIAVLAIIAYVTYGSKLRKKREEAVDRYKDVLDIAINPILGGKTDSTASHAQKFATTSTEREDHQRLVPA